MLNAAMNSFISSSARPSDLILFSEHFTKRGERTLMHNGYKYSMHQQSRVNPDVQFWRCTVRRPMHCKGRIEVNVGTAFGRITNGYHWHPPYYSRAMEKREDRERGRLNGRAGEFSSEPTGGPLLDDSNDPDIVLLEDSTPPPTNNFMTPQAPPPMQAQNRAFKTAPAQSHSYPSAQSTTYYPPISSDASLMGPSAMRSSDGLQREDERLYSMLERLFVDHRCLLCDERVVHKASRVRHFEIHHRAELQRMERKSAGARINSNGFGGNMSSQGLSTPSGYTHMQSELPRRKRPKTHTSLCDYFETLPGGDGRSLRCRLCGVIKARSEVTASSLWQHLLLVHGIANPHPGPHVRPAARLGGSKEDSHQVTPASSGSMPSTSHAGTALAADYSNVAIAGDYGGEEGEKRSRMDEEIEFNMPIDSSYYCSSLTDLLLRSTVMQQRQGETVENVADLQHVNRSSAPTGGNGQADSLVDEGSLRLGEKKDASPASFPLLPIKAEEEETGPEKDGAHNSYANSVVQVMVESNPSCLNRSAPSSSQSLVSPTLAMSTFEEGEEVMIGPAFATAEQSGKRMDYLNWDEFFMGTALLAAQRSKDPCTQVGAVIANEENIIVSIGYNGMPIGCSDDELPWGKGVPDPLSNKYLYVCHAEMNAVLNKNSGSLRNSTIYCTMFPCNECAKLIIQSRIKRVVYLADKPNKVEMVASRRLFSMAGVEYSQFTPKRSLITLDFQQQQLQK